MDDNVTIAAKTLPWNGQGANVGLWIYATKPFVTEAGTPVNATSPVDAATRLNAYKKATCTFGAGTITVPAITLSSTTDADVNNDTTLVAYFMDLTNAAAPRPILGFSVFGGTNYAFRVPPTPTSTNWGDLGIYSAGGVPSSATDAAVTGNLTVGVDLTVGDDLGVGDDATIGDDLSVGHNLTVGNTGAFGGSVSADEFFGDLTGDVTGDLTGNVTGATGDFSGNVSAATFTGDGSGLTNVGVGTSTGHSAPGSVTIMGDNDANGTGVVAIGTRNITRLQIENDGQLNADDASGLENLSGANISSETAERDRFARYYLRNFQAQVGKIKNGDAAYASVVWVGDSIGAMEYISKPLREALQATFGDAGVGYVAATSIAPTGMNVAAAGTWVQRDIAFTPGAQGLAVYDMTSSDIATPASLLWNGSNDQATEIVIHYLKKSGGGSFRYRVNAGSWTTVNTANATDLASFVTISGLTYGDYQMTVEVTAAGTTGVTIFGAEYRITGRPGVSLSLVAHTGSQAQHFAATNATLWQAQLAALNPTTVILEWGHNEASNGTLPAAMKTSLTTLITRVRAAAPLADILLIGPYDKGTALPAGQEMIDYSNMTQDLAREQGTAFLDFYKIIGPHADGASRGLLSDPAHVNAQGGRALAGHMYAFFDEGFRESHLQTGVQTGPLKIPYEAGTNTSGLQVLTNDITGNILYNLHNNGTAASLDLGATGTAFQVRDSSGNILIHISTTGFFGVGGAAAGFARIEVTTHNAGAPAIIGKGLVSQTASIIQARDSGGTEKAGLAADGLRVNTVKVVGAQGAAVANATDAASVITQLNALLARLRAHGLIAT